MIPTSFMIPTVTASSGLGALMGPAAVVGLVALLVVLGVLLARIAADADPGRAARPALDGGARVQPLLRRAA